MWTPENVKSLRQDLGETQDEFAKHFRLSIGAVQNWEQGKQIPSGPATVILDQLLMKILQQLQSARLSATEERLTV